MRQGDQPTAWRSELQPLRANSSRLHAIHAGLALELANAEPPLLSISASGDRPLFELVHEIVSRAPEPLPVRVVAFRQRGPVAGSDVNLPNGSTLSSDGIWFRIEILADPELGLGLHVFVRDFPPEMQRPWQEAAYLLLDNALGEEDVATKIAWIEWAALPHDPARRGTTTRADTAPYRWEPVRRRSRR